MISPIKIDGLWDEGYILDMYIQKSIPLREDAFGNMYFETTYTQIGKLLHDMKYNGRIDTSTSLVDYSVDFVNTWLAGKSINVILTVPPTKVREVQPVFIIAEAFAERLNIPCQTDILKKVGNIESKSLTKTNKQLQGSIIQVKPAKFDCNILLVDDFYSTGSTANECISVLRADKRIRHIYYLAIAKTK